MDEATAGRVAECPTCRHVVPVPGRLLDALGTTGMVGALPALPRGVLALEVKFLCPGCEAKLRIDARLAGELVECPRCEVAMRVPHWSAAPSAVEGTRVLQTARLSAAEIEFLSGPQEVRERHAAAQ